MANIFDDVPTQPQGNIFDKVPAENPQPDLSTVGMDDPYTKYKLEESKSPNLEDYSLAVPPSLNPNYDLPRQMTTEDGKFSPKAVLGTARDALEIPLKVGETAIRKVLDAPAEIKNAITGAKPDDYGAMGFRRYTPTISDREEISPDGNIIHFPRSSGTGPIAGAANTVSDLATGFLGTPEKIVSLALVPGEGALGRGAAGLYGANAAASIPGAVQNAYRLTTNPDPNATVAQEVEALAQPVIQSAFAKQMLGHAVGDEPTPEAPQVQGPYSLGRYLNTPRGAEPELRVEESQPLDAQSGSPLTPQELIARQSRPITPTPVERPVKTFDLDKEMEESNATETRQEPSNNQPEHSGDASQRPPAQPGGGGSVEQRTQTPEGNEPVTPTGDARREADKKVSQISDGLSKIADMNGEEFAKHVRTKEGGLTGEAYRIGQSVSTPDELTDLKSKQDAEGVKFQDAKAKKDFNAMNAAAMKGQFFREAYEAATGTGSAGKSLRESNPNYKPPFPEGKTPELVGMGGATPSELTGEHAGREFYGISQEAREARAKAGVVDPVEPGEGITRDESIERGRQLLNAGADPEKILSNFEKTGRISGDDIAITRAHGEKLAQDARLTERKFGTDSPEYEAAYNKLSDWDKRTKGMGTESHRAFVAQQGVTDIDTGSITGLQREHESNTGKKFTPEEKTQATKKAKDVTEKAEAAEKAGSELLNELDKESGDAKTRTAAEKRALDAANKTVREAAARTAEAENKARVAKSAAEKKAAEAARKKEQKILDLANKQARDAATRLADAENAERVEAAKKVEDDTQAKAAQKAIDAANKTVRDAAARKAKAESDARTAKSDKDRKAAQVEAKREQDAIDAANKVIRDNAAKAAEAARKENVLRADKPAWAWKLARKYLDQGIKNFDDLASKVATDMGVTMDKAKAFLGKKKRVKQLADDLWQKQQDYRNADAHAKRWLAELNTPGLVKALKAVPDWAFKAKVFGHGFVALGTHAPMVAFQPRYWNAYIRDFAKMYGMVGSRSFHESQMQNLLRAPNYMLAKRAGLQNDPYQYEEFQTSSNAPKWFQYISKAGDRGYAVLKILRQDMFDQQWNKLPKTQQIPEVAKAIADGVNHATGVVKGKAPRGSNIALFAPRLAASRVAWLGVDPAKAAGTFLNWKNASEGEKMFAVNQVKEKAWVVGTMLSLLALNEGFLEASGSNQHINLDDPMKKDFLKFKVAGLNIGYGNAMLSMARLPARLYQIRESNGGKLRNLVYPDEDTYSVLGEYGRSQLSPFASLATTLWFKGDWQNRPLPDSTRPVPKRLKAQGVKPYTWPEFWSEQVLPIPAEEAAREVWKSGMGMSDQQIEHARKALATLSIMSATGARVEDDTDLVRR